MKRSEKIEIAKSFISRHKNDNIGTWGSPPSEGGPEYGANEDTTLIHVYDNLAAGEYGNVTTDEECDDEGEVTKPADECQIELSAFETKSGNTETFEWYLNI